MARPPKSLLKDSHPYLAQELVDKSLLDTLATGADRLVEWECSQGHRYMARPYNRTGSSQTGCPYCNGKIVLEGFNDIATTRPELVKYFVDKSLTKTLTQFSSKKVDVVCEKGHQRKMPVRNLANQGLSCPYCSGRYPIVGENDLATTHPKLAAELVDQRLATQLKAGSNKVVEWHCSAGHVWKALVSNRANKGYGCPYCSGRNIIVGENDFATTHPEYARTLVRPEEAFNFASYSSVKVEWQCQKYSNHTWWTVPGLRIRSAVESGCPICDNKKILVGFNDLATTHPDVAAQLVDQDLATKLVAGSFKKVEWICEEGHTWITTVAHRTSSSPTGCPICNIRGTSLCEQELADFVKKLVGEENVQTNVVGVLDGRLEIDVYVPSRNVAIEFNGVRWHSEAQGKDRQYHRNKVIDAKQKGIQLIHIWEDDWRLRKDAVLRLVAAKLGCTADVWQYLSVPDKKVSERLFARKLQVKEVTSKEAGAFLDANHIQGKVTSSVRLALVDDENYIRALLCLRSPRNNARMKRAPGEWEIQRYATYGQVVGGFSRLVAHAEKLLLERGDLLTRWISFSSNDVSDGTMYEKCGFVAEREIPPDYRYVGEQTDWIRKSKESFQRKDFRRRDDLVWDESWTERIAAEKNGLYRIYDSGKIRWIKDIS